MTARERAAVGLVVSAAGLGILGDLLFNGRPLGINAVLFAVVVRARAGRDPARRPHPAAPGPAADGGAAARVRRPARVARVAAAAGREPAGDRGRGHARRAAADAAAGAPRREVSDYVAGAASAGAATFVGAVKLIEQDVPWRAVRERVGKRENAAAIGRGLVLGLPLLAIFGGLFVAADAVFRSLLFGAVPDWGASGRTSRSRARSAGRAAGLLRDLLATREEERVLGGTIDAIGRRRVPIGPTEVAVALAIVDAAVPRLRRRPAALPLRRPRPGRVAAAPDLRRVRAARLLRAGRGRAARAAAAARRRTRSSAAGPSAAAWSACCRRR